MKKRTLTDTPKPKLESVLQQRKDAGVPSKLGFSYNTKPGQKIQVAAEFISCSPLSKGNSNFLRTGLKDESVAHGLKGSSERAVQFQDWRQRANSFRLGAVWDLTLQPDPEGPTLIFHAALLPSSLLSEDAFVAHDDPKSLRN